MTSYVYIVQVDSDGPIKIGKSNNVENRIKTMQTGNHLKIELIYKFSCKSQAEAFNLERELHKLLEDARMRTYGGSEWFKKRGIGLLKKYSVEVMTKGTLKGEEPSNVLHSRLVEFNIAFNPEVNPRFIKAKNGKRTRRNLGVLQHAKTLRLVLT